MHAFDERVVQPHGPRRQPVEVATVAFLASFDASYITGEMRGMDGGNGLTETKES